MTRQPSLFRGSGLPPALKPPFSEFWKAYPPRQPNPRALAEAAFAAAVQAGHTPADLVAAARGYAEECKRLGVTGPFVVHASTFLRQGRFLDYVPQRDASGTPMPATGPEIDHPLWSALRDRMSAADFRAWVGKCEVVAWSQGEALMLRAPTRFHANHLRAHFLVQLRGIARDVAITIAGEDPQA